MARSRAPKTTYVTLQDEYGRMERYLPLHEFQGLKSRTDYQRLSARIWRKVKPVEASDSQESPTQLTQGDMEFLVSFRGMPRKTNENLSLIEKLEQRVERIRGHLMCPRLAAA